MKTINLYFLSLCLSLFVVSNGLNAQTFNPSPQQIEQFKNLPRAQQEQLARQMGFDISILSQSSQDTQIEAEDEVDFVERNINSKNISKELAKQSTVEDASAELKPFGYDIFESREEAVSPNKFLPVPSNYTIGPGDSVKLQLFGKETGEFELQVTNEGNINLPDLGPLQVLGSSFQELKILVREKFQQQKIGVNAFVSMGQVRTIQVFLVGEVHRPGPLIVSGLSTVTTALINSGGINEIGSLRNIEVKRGGKTVTQFDLYDLIVRGETSDDIRLEQGDVLFVPTAETIVSVEGQVRRPAIYELAKNETIADLLSLAGGLLPGADGNSLQLVRNDTANGLSINNVKLSDGSTMRKIMRNGDFLRVPKANLEFNNAIVVNGAVNLPNIIADTGLMLSDVITEQTLLSNTDLNYAVILRKKRFDKVTTVIQFSPLEVLSKAFDIDLQAFDELILFNRVSQKEVDRSSELKTSRSSEKPEEDIKTAEERFAKEAEEARMLQQVEETRFKTDAFNRDDNSDFSRKALLSAVISRLKSEASNEHPLQVIELTGQVKYPGVYPLPINNSLKNILDAGGGLTESAHLESAEITRLEVISGVSNIDHKRISLFEQLSLPEAQQLKLQSKDVLNVVRIPQWFESNIIELKGEVVFPGTYQISEGETLSSVVERAGGLTEKASVSAAVFSREELKQKEIDNIERAIEDLRQQIANNNLSTSQFSQPIDYKNATQVLNDLTNITPVGRMVIDLDAITRGDIEADIALKDGDLLVVPNITPAVSIIGEVFVSTTYRFDPTLSVDDYIGLAGGIREYGDASKLYIVKANGAVVVPDSDFWFSSKRKSVLEPGDTIVVPRDVTNYESISLWQGITQIFYQSAVALAAIGGL